MGIDELCVNTYVPKNSLIFFNIIYGYRFSRKSEKSEVNGFVRDLNLFREYVFWDVGISCLFG